MMFRAPSRAACSLSLAMVLLVATTLVAQQLTPSRSSQGGSIARQVVHMIEANQISQMPVNDKISERLVTQFVKDLDPQKLYFLKADIDQFSRYRDSLDDALKAGNVDFAFMVFNLYLQRLDERIAHALKLIDMPHDFTAQELMAVDAKEIPWSATSEELNERWRKRIKYDLLVLKFDKVAEDEARKRLHKRYKNIKGTMHKTDEDEVVEIYLTALCSTFDPHSSYMSPRSYEDFRIQMNLSLDGIGAALKSEDGYTIVNSIVPGGAAATDGKLKKNDKIIGVSNEKGEMVEVTDMKLTKVVDLIRGKRGTKVRLQVITAESGETKLYDLVRAKVELKMSEVKGEIVPTGTRIKGTNNRIGVIHIPSFYRDFAAAESGDSDFKSTARDVRKVLRDFAARGGVDAVVIDLRTNGGGALNEAIEVSGLFINDGPVVQVKTQKGRVKELNDEEAGTDFAGPLVVITNRLSASASEIFAGVIKDYGRGIIVGDSTTHGKGTVQSVMNVGSPILKLLNPPDQGALKLTIQQFYRVNGDSTQTLGVPSDVVLPSFLDNMDLGESFLENAMKFEHIDPAPHDQMKLVNSDIVATLVERSRKRIASDKDFSKTRSDIEKYLARKQKKSVSLNEEEMRKERIDDEQKTKDKLDLNDEFTEGPVFPVNAYNNEVLSVTLDYLERLREMKTAKK